MAALRDAQVFETGQALMHCPDTSSDPTGAPMHLLTSKIPLRGKDGAVETLLSVSIDITPQKRAEERAEAVARELARSRDMLRLVIDNVPATISVKDSLRRYILVNKAQLAFWGVPIETALGKRFDVVLPPWDSKVEYADRVVGKASVRSLDKKTVLQMISFSPGWSIESIENGFDVYEEPK